MHNTAIGPNPEDGATNTPVEQSCGGALRVPITFTQMSGQPGQEPSRRIVGNQAANNRFLLFVPVPGPRKGWTLEIYTGVAIVLMAQGNGAGALGMVYSAQNHSDMVEPGLLRDLVFRWTRMVPS
ncbi:uncharacterized protein SCHCODRAFT_02491160 [Schizophyllum commune H4-8]|uniref:Uncharacterized protein n=1 Tax=Schizophyllum commune (strain H4-8 / FGSC 9210) TaxID=578458 RepID=D8PYI7_SCHCM|nr:uncharacterized protein SCHCODRAFT_02491160 [Schizophyllum commune H4-8]KAI5895981.1 hypothetical protein SCHCODRAFT_02491160 [Schizophyllum commune H4-8]